MTIISDIHGQLKLIEASRRIVSIYARCGQEQAAREELSSLGHLLNANRDRRGM
jgi:hypothetical protein